MTFEELLDQISYDYKHPVRMPDGKLNADRNGNMRISELVKKYSLSSLKVQKLLVTAGVYEPVKKDANYDLVRSLYEAGKSMSEIADETQLSKATINGFLPYERSMKNAEAFNIDVSSAADRKRKQRDKESRRKGYMRNALTSSLSEDDLWDALASHEHEKFIATTGQKFSIKVTPSYPKPTYDPHYYFSPRSTTENELIITSEGDKLHISKEELYNAFYRALEIKADCMDPGDPRSYEVYSDINNTLGVHDKYLRPLFIFLGILPGDIDKTTTKRVVSEVRKCSCCGKETPELYNVTSFEDLIKLDARFKADRAAALTENHGSEDRYADPVLQKMQLYYADKKKETLEKARASKSVKAFNSEGIRSLCKLCSETIYMALEEGEMPVSPSRAGYDNLPSEVLHDYIISNTEAADCDYYQALFGKFHAYEFDNKNMLLFTAVDKESIAHYFALTVTKYPLEETNIGIGFRGLEVHKLTRAGRIAANSTATDYDIYHFRLCHDGDDYQKTVYIGIIELMDKIASILNTHTLHESHFPADNLITIDGRHYGINSIGTIIPVYVENSKNYRSMEGREWDGGEYGFLIDGKLFSGSDLALILSSHQGFQMQFVCESDSEDVLQDGIFLMRVNLSEQTLIDETVELINMFSINGKFGSDKERSNFEKLFNKYVLSKFKVYTNSRPLGYGRLAAMSLIKTLNWVEGTQTCQDNIRALIRL